MTECRWYFSYDVANILCTNTENVFVHKIFSVFASYIFMCNKWEDIYIYSLCLSLQIIFDFANYSHQIFPAAMDRMPLSVCGDVAMFIGFLAITTIYPLWNDITGRKGKLTKASYIFATGRVSMLPMMFSIARGVLSVRSLLGKTNPSTHSIVALQYM